MTNDNRDGGVSENNTSLELNKETLKDLDLVPGRPEDVKGGGVSITSHIDLRPDSNPPVVSALPTVCTVVGPHR